MRPFRRALAPVAALATALVGMATLGGPAVADRSTGAGYGDHRPDKVVVIVVDALSREIVQKYHMRNVEALMRHGANAPNAYLGHLGSVTVVSHNVIPTGALPKHMGWTDEGYRDVDGVLAFEATNGSGMWLTSDFGKDEMFALQDHAGYPHLADYLHAKRPGSKVVAVSPKSYAAWGLGGRGADRIITFSGRDYDCDGDGVANWRGPDGVNVPDYLSKPTCGRFYVNSDPALTYDTDQSPARLYPLDGNRYTVGFDRRHQGGDVWATDAALSVMKHERNWSGVLVTLPDVDKSAHMWGSVDDDGGDVPMTHLAAAARVADHQVGRIVGYLHRTGQLRHTLVVLTADHGSVPGRHFYGVDDGTPDRGYYNWYYGDMENDSYLSPQPALQPLVDTGNVAMSYSDSMLRAWLKDQSPAKRRQAARVMFGLPGVSAVWIRHGDHFNLASRVRWERMSKPERAWFAAKAQKLLNTTAAPYGADVIATLLDDTTYSVAGDHGGIQRRSQQIPIVFAGGGVGSRDLRAQVRSVDITPTILRALHIRATHRLDGHGYHLPGLR
jgi:predicted AlkP superfamily pyrophosphatase or phosphodiesterase